MEVIIIKNNLMVIKNYNKCNHINGYYYDIEIDDKNIQRVHFYKNYIRVFFNDGSESRSFIKTESGGDIAICTVSVSGFILFIYENIPNTIMKMNLYNGETIRVCNCEENMFVYTKVGGTHDKYLVRSFYTEFTDDVSLNSKYRVIIEGVYYKTTYDITIDGIHELATGNLVKFPSNKLSFYNIEIVNGLIDRHNVIDIIDKTSNIKYKLNLTTGRYYEK